MRGERTAVIVAGACAVVGLVAIGVIRGSDARGRSMRGTRLDYSMDLQGVENPDAALRRAVQVVRDRVSGFDADAAVFARGDGLVVEIGDIGDEAVAQIEDVIARTAKLELVIVDDGTAAMRDLAAAIGQSDRARALDVTTDNDFWHAESGESHQDVYLRAYDRDAIQRAVDAVAGDAPDDGLPPDHVLAYELVEGSGVSRPYWRSYLLDTTRRLDGSAVTSASMTWEPQTHRPVAQIELGPDGAAAFAELTRANLGRKLAIVLDGRVKSAPVINGEIHGQIQITMGGDRPLDQEREATDLAAVLRAGSLPAPLRLESERPFGFRAAGGNFLARSWMFFAGALVLAAALVVFRVRASASRS